MYRDSRREAPTANLTIRRLDPAVKERLRVRAARHGHSMEEQSHPAVAGWLRVCPPEAMFTTAISRGEIVYRIRRLPDGVRRRRLERAAMTMFAEEFPDRVLPFDAEAADLYADLRIPRAQQGHPLAVDDGMIAAIARTHAATVVTRDVGGFERCGVAIINPWEC